MPPRSSVEAVVPADCVSELDLGAVERQDCMPTVFAAYEYAWGGFVDWFLRGLDTKYRRRARGTVHHGCYPVTAKAVRLASALTTGGTGCSVSSI